MIKHANVDYIPLPVVGFPDGTLVWDGREKATQPTIAQENTVFELKDRAHSAQLLQRLRNRSLDAVKLLSWKDYFMPNIFRWNNRVKYAEPFGRELHVWDEA